MLLPLLWLRDFVDVDITVDKLAEKLFTIGFEVEEIRYLGKDIERVVSCKILKIAPHENADKLQVCTVSIGGEDTLQIVTAAKNVSEGDIVALALDNSTLPGGKIKSGKLRGVLSQGMFCGLSELGIDENFYESDPSGVLVLPSCTAIGEDIKKIVGLDDYVLDISITANRPDCQSIYGMAREIAALLSKKVKPVPTYYQTNTENIHDYLEVEVKNSELCNRYIAEMVKDIVIAKSPLEMRKRLFLCGHKPINNIVDITNFVLLELGNPTHAFDYRHIADKKIIVRNFDDGEKFITLNDKENTMTSSMLAICDGEKPVAIGGVMGGKNSQVENDTSEIVFEIAKFARDNIRKTSRQLGLKTDASARYEKGVDSNSCLLAAERILNLIYANNIGTIVGGKIGDLSVDERKKIITDIPSINGVLGIQIARQTILSILENLDFEFKEVGDKIEILVPLYREDIEDYPDISEEVIRYYGFEHIKGKLLTDSSITNGGKTAFQVSLDKVKKTMVSEGYFECVTYSFIHPKLYERAMLSELSDSSIKLINPLSVDISVMRQKLFMSMLGVVKTNISKKNLSGRLFELARTYEKGEQLAKEVEHLCFGAFGEEEDFFTLKGTVEALFEAFNVDYTLMRSNQKYLHSGISADIISEGELIGSFGELSPVVAENLDIRTKVYIAEINIEKLLQYANHSFNYKNIPEYQAIKRDIALIVKSDIVSSEIVASIQKNGGKLLESVQIFDIYKGKNLQEGYISLAFSLDFRAKDRTLREEEITKDIDRILKAVQAEFDARLR